MEHTSKTESPFNIRVYDRDFKFRAPVVDCTYVNVVSSWADQGYASFMLAPGNPHMPKLEDRGARVTIEYLGHVEVSGPIRSWQGDVLGKSGTIYQVLDWTRLLLHHTRAWVRPSDDLAAATLSDLAQAWVEDPTRLEAGSVRGHYGYIQWPDGSAQHGGETITSAEQAIKWICKQNLVDRLGLPIEIMPNRGRGGDPRQVKGALARVRWVELYEACTPLEKMSGLGIRIWQDPTEDHLRLDVIEPGRWPQEITAESGIITDGSYSVRAPELTRTVVGGPSETAAGRVMGGQEGRYPINAREADYGIVLETFKDATGYTLEWPDGTPDHRKVAKYWPLNTATPEQRVELADYFDTVVQEAWDEGAPTTSLALKLAETDHFRYAPGRLRLGHRVRFRLAGGARISDHVTSVQMTFTREDGTVITPIIGNWDEDEDEELARIIARLARGLTRRYASR